MKAGLMRMVRRPWFKLGVVLLVVIALFVLPLLASVSHRIHVLTRDAESTAGHLTDLALAGLKVVAVVAAISLALLLVMRLIAPLLRAPAVVIAPFVNATGQTSLDRVTAAVSLEARRVCVPSLEWVKDTLDYHRVQLLPQDYRLENVLNRVADVTDQRLEALMEASSAKAPEEISWATPLIRALLPERGTRVIGYLECRGTAGGTPGITFETVTSHRAGVKTHTNVITLWQDELADSLTGPSVSASTDSHASATSASNAEAQPPVDQLPGQYYQLVGPATRMLAIELLRQEMREHPPRRLTAKQKGIYDAQCHHCLGVLYYVCAQPIVSEAPDIADFFCRTAITELEQARDLYRGEQWFHLFLYLGLAYSLKAQVAPWVARAGTKAPQDSANEQADLLFRAAHHYATASKQATGAAPEVTYMLKVCRATAQLRYGALVHGHRKQQQQGGLDPDIQAALREMEALHGPDILRLWKAPKGKDGKPERTTPDYVSDALYYAACWYAWADQLAIVDCASLYWKRQALRYLACSLLVDRRWNYWEWVTQDPALYPLHHAIVRLQCALERAFPLSGAADRLPTADEIWSASNALVADAANETLLPVTPHHRS